MPLFARAATNTSRCATRIRSTASGQTRQPSTFTLWPTSSSSPRTPLTKRATSMIRSQTPKSTQHLPGLGGIPKRHPSSVYHPARVAASGNDATACPSHARRPGQGSSRRRRLLPCCRLPKNWNLLARKGKCSPVPSPSQTRGRTTSCTRSRRRRPPITGCGQTRGSASQVPPSTSASNAVTHQGCRFGTGTSTAPLAL